MFDTNSGIGLGFMGSETNNIENVISRMSEKERKELISVLLNDLGKDGKSKKNKKDDDPFFSEGLTDPLNW